VVLLHRSSEGFAVGALVGQRLLKPSPQVGVPGSQVC